jgi:type IX secretion system PorP/SprF family membrane protein
MKIKIKSLIVLLILNFGSKAQDISYSQFDLNTMYTNPAFSSFEEDNRILSIFRNQWNGFSENFNSNYIEFGFSISDLKKRRISSGQLSASAGLFLNQDVYNNVFKTYEFGIVPITIHSQISRNYFLSTGISNTIRINSLDWNNLVFTDQINDFNNQIAVSNVQLPDNFNQKTWLDPSIGIILTKHSNMINQAANTTFIGFSWHHFVSPIKSFYNNQNEISRIPQKIIIHGQYLSQFRLLSSNSLKFWKLSYQHTQQGSRAVVNDNIGLSLTMQNNLQLELGCFYKIGRQTIRNDQVRLMSESLIPMLRIRMQIGRRLGMELSYSYDFNVSKLNNTNTVSTNEISLNIYHFKKKKSNICPFQGNDKINKKWDDIMMNSNGYQINNKKRRSIW